MKRIVWFKSAVSIAGLAVFCFLAAGSTDSDSSTSSGSSAPREKVANSEWDAAVPQVVDYLKRNLKDPDSAQWIEWSKVQEVSGQAHKYMVRCKYRAKNSFGGYEVANQIFYLDADGNVINVVDIG